MSMPAGWYDDGSGRQRWWDGARWTEHFAPDAGSVVPPVSAPVARVAPALGFVGLALAVLGTILACIPATFIVGVGVLIAGFALSLIGVFKKNAPKWPSIVGLVLSVAGGAIGTVVTLVIVAASLAGPSDPGVSTEPSPTISEQPSAPASSEPPASEGRPAADALGEALLADLQRSDIHDYDDDPEFISCWGEFVYASELSDEALQEYVETLTLTGQEAALLTSVSTDATVTCGAQ
jgi:hypothetical protein